LGLSCQNQDSCQLCSLSENVSALAPTVALLEVSFISAEENFREAKHLKMVVEELLQAGEVLCRYEVEKKDAIDREDYDTARARKVRVQMCFCFIQCGS
jgi:UDP-glucose 6-dehydrogenase